MDELKQIVESELKSKKLNYEYNEQKKIFFFNMTMDNSVGTLRVVVHILTDAYVVYAILNNPVNKKKAFRVAEYLHRANRGLLNGNFEYDFNDGEIRFKVYVNAKDVKISEAIVEDSIIVPLSMFSLYGDGLLQVMFGKEDPEKIIQQIEKV